MRIIGLKIWRTAFQERKRYEGQITELAGKKDDERIKKPPQQH